jgi:hypothetical protein
LSVGVLGDEFGVGHGIVGLPVGELTGLVTGLLFFKLIFIHVVLFINLGGDSRDWSLPTKSIKPQKLSKFINMFTVNARIICLK